MKTVFKEFKEYPTGMYTHQGVPGVPRAGGARPRARSGKTHRMVHLIFCLLTFALLGKEVRLDVRRAEHLQVPGKGTPHRRGDGCGRTNTHFHRQV